MESIHSPQLHELLVFQNTELQWRKIILQHV